MDDFDDDYEIYEEQDPHYLQFWTDPEIEILRIEFEDLMVFNQMNQELFSL